MSASRLEHALALAALDLRVFPVRPGEKLPAIKGWPTLATLDPAQIRAWWTEKPNFNIGVCGGPMRDGRFLVIIDADVKGGGLASLDLMRERGLPPSRTAQSAGGGRHVLLATTAAIGERIRNGARHVPGFPGIDIRSQGGFIVGVGSEVGGKPYVWLDEGPIADLPDWLADLLAQAKAPTKPADRTAVGPTDGVEGLTRAADFIRKSAPVSTQDAGGDDTAFRVSCRLFDFGLSEETAFQIMRDDWNLHPDDGGKADPPWPLDELRRKVANAYRYRQKAPGVALAEGEFEAVLPVDPGSAGDDGPLDLFGHDDDVALGDVPAGALPPMLMRWVRTEARRKGVSQAFAAASAIAAVAASIGNSLRLQVRQHDTGWTEPAGLWIVLVGPPGSAKSPIVSVAVEPLNRLDNAFVRAWNTSHAAWKKRAASKAKDAPDPGPEPICRRLTVDSMTIERLVQILADNPNGVICTSDELTNLLGSLGAYKTKSEGDRTALLRLFEARPMKTDRVTSGNSIAETALMSILAGTQPAVIQAQVENLGIDGLLQRLLFVMYDGVERIGIDEKPDAEAVATYRRMIEVLAAPSEFMADDPFGSPEPVRLSPEAGALMATADAEIRDLKHLPSMSHAWAGHVEKWGKFLPRFALVIHAVVEFERHGRVEPTKPIGAETAAMAIRFGRFMLRHQMQFHQAFGEAPLEEAEAREIADFLLTKPDLRFATVRDIYRGRRGLSGIGGRKLLRDAMTYLELMGWVHVTERQPGEGPTKWRVDERIHTRYAAHAERAKATRSARREAILRAAVARGWTGGDDLEAA